MRRLGQPDPPAATEAEIVAALKTAFGLAVPVWWGYAPAEEVETPPSLPLVAVLRSLATVRTDWGDMCEDPPEWATPADVTVRVNVWHPNYGEARALQRTVRATLRALDGWTETSEADARDNDLRAFLISSDWLAVAVPLD
jgi:hypothetical protein